MSDWRRQLRTPMGQLQLMAATLMGASVFAGFLTTQDAFFRSYLQERPEVTTAATQSLVNELVRGTDLPLTEKDQQALYDALLISAEALQPPILDALAIGDPPWLCVRAERTLIGGSPKQALRALKMVKGRDEPWCREMLVQVSVRVERMGPEALKVPLRAALSR